jgi:hypothetical protein
LNVDDKKTADKPEPARSVTSAPPPISTTQKPVEEKQDDENGTRTRADARAVATRSCRRAPPRAHSTASS